MNDIKIYGYKYNNVGEIIVDKEGAEIVKSIFELTGNYKLNASEIADFLNGTKTISEIICNRIDDFIIVISKYSKNKAKILKECNYYEVLNDNKLIQEKLIDPLLKIKDGKLDLNIVNDIDDLIYLLKNKDELANKYSDVKKTDFQKNSDVDLDR